MLVEMELREILRGGDPNGTAPIVLGEKNGEGRQFPVFVGQHEASVLEMTVHKVELPRPLTHDLVLNIIHDMAGTLKRVIVDDLVEEDNGHGTFLGKLDIELSDHTSIWVDSRPSDAIIIACKVGVPIYVDDKVLRKAGAAQTEPEDDVE